MYKVFGFQNCIIDDSHEIEFFNKFDCIFNYDEITNHDKDQLNKMINKLYNDKIEIEIVLNSMNEKYKKHNMHLYDRCVELGFMIKSLIVF